MWCVIDSTLNTAYTPAREGRTAHKGPAESDNPKSNGCTQRQLPCRVVNMENSIKQMG